MIDDAVTGAEREAPIPSKGKEPWSFRAVPRTFVGGLRNYSGIYVFVAMFVIFSLWVPETFLTVRTAQSIAQLQSVTAIVAIALLIPMAAGEFDVSIGASLGLGGILVTKLQSEGVALATAIAVTLLVGLCVGLFNGFIVARLHVNSFVATLGTQSILSAAAYLVSGNQNITTGLSETFLNLGQGTVFGIPNLVIFLAVVAAAVWFLTEMRPLGRRLYATGGNRTAARLSGIRTQGIIVFSMCCSAVIATFAGILYASQVGSGSVSAGPTFLLPAFAAVFLGSTQIHNGKVNVLGTLVAVLVLGTGVKGLLLVGADFWISDLFNGLSLIIAVALAVRQVKTRPSSGPEAVLDEDEDLQPTGAP